MSKTALRQAYYSIGQTIDKSTLSFQSRDDYKHILRLVMQQLHQVGFTLSSVNQLKQKHIDRLVTDWTADKLSAGTIKNRLSVLRLTATLIGKKNLMRSNQDYGIAGRQYLPTVSKGIHAFDFALIKHPYVRMSLMLQQAFGLRREESIKFKPHQADKGNAIELQASWTKGGIQRILPISTPEQRACLDQAKALVKANSALIPEGKSYKSQRIQYDNQVRLAGLSNPHGLRHAYAQQRYLALTNRLTHGYGWKAPIEGGPERKSLNADEKKIDEQVRLMISHELGHSRVGITKSYLNSQH